MCQEIIANISQVVVGKRRAIELMLVAFLAEGHVLLEDIPGVGKTLMEPWPRASLGMPNGPIHRFASADIISCLSITISQKVSVPSGTRETNVLADGLTALSRTRASLLSMEEGQVTVDGATLPLPRPFFVIRHPEPHRAGGTFPLPEAD